jgi:hypothetical protein
MIHWRPRRVNSFFAKNVRAISPHRRSASESVRAGSADALERYSNQVVSSVFLRRKVAINLTFVIGTVIGELLCYLHNYLSIAALIGPGYRAMGKGR